MLDMISFWTKLEVNEDTINEIKVADCNFTFQLNVSGYRVLYYFRRPSIPWFKLFVGKNLFGKGAISLIEFNPNRFESLGQCSLLLDNLFKCYDPTKCFVNRLDFNVDLNLPFHFFFRHMVRPHVKQKSQFTSSKGIPESMILGRPPKETKVYDKSIQSKKARINPLKIVESISIDTTRIETKVLKRRNRAFPIKTFDQLPLLLDYDPFSRLSFLELNGSPPEDDKFKAIKEALKDEVFGSMQDAYKLARSHLGLKNKKDLNKYLNAIDDAPKLFSIHRDQLDHFLSKTNHQSISIGDFELN